MNGKESGKRSAILTEQFKWVDYYEEFASKLLEYRNNRKELIGKIENVGWPSVECNPMTDMAELVRMLTE